MIRRLVFALIFSLGITGAAAAQTGGQLCVRSFEDRNGNGQRDGSEIVLTRGVGVNLLDTSGVTIASSLLDTSPTAAQGVVCFQFLPAGQYSVVMTSAEYTATTPDTITTSITDGGLPVVVEFGARLAITPTPDAAASDAPELNTTQLLLSGVGALLVVGFMAFLGMLVYWFAFGRRPAPDPRYTTGSMRAVRATGEHRRTGEVHATTDTGTSRRVPAEADDPFQLPDDPQ